MLLTNVLPKDKFIGRYQTAYESLKTYQTPLFFRAPIFY